jgi:RNA polymerase sigma-70 factor (ECF subfamily)
MQTEIIQAQIIELRAELVRFASRMTRSTTKAEDIVQDAIIRLLNSERVFTENDNFRAYAYATVRNTALNSFERKEGKTVQLFGKNDDGSKKGNNECVEELLNAQGARSAEDTALFDSLSPNLANALASLHEGIRETFLLVTVQGLQYEECAEFQNISIGTVMSRISRAKKQIKESLTNA